MASIRENMALTLIPEKSYEKFFLFFVTLTFPKPSAAKVLNHNSVSITFKANTSLYSNAFQYSGATKAK